MNSRGLPSVNSTGVTVGNHTRPLASDPFRLRPGCKSDSRCSNAGSWRTHLARLTIRVRPRGHSNRRPQRHRCAEWPWVSARLSRAAVLVARTMNTLTKSIFHFTTGRVRGFNGMGARFRVFPIR